MFGREKSSNPSDWLRPLDDLHEALSWMKASHRELGELLAIKHLGQKINYVKTATTLDFAKMIFTLDWFHDFLHIHTGDSELDEVQRARAKYISVKRSSWIKHLDDMIEVADPHTKRSIARWQKKIPELFTS